MIFTLIVKMSLRPQSTLQVVKHSHEKAGCQSAKILFFKNHTMLFDMFLIQKVNVLMMEAECSGSIDQPSETVSRSTESNRRTPQHKSAQPLGPCHVTF